MMATHPSREIDKVTMIITPGFPGGQKIPLPVITLDQFLHLLLLLFQHYRGVSHVILRPLKDVTTIIGEMNAFGILNKIVLKPV